MKNNIIQKVNVSILVFAMIFGQSGAILAQEVSEMVNTPEPAPVVETPAPVVETPAPVVEEVTPVVEEVAPAVEESAPIIEPEVIGGPIIDTLPQGFAPTEKAVEPVLAQSVKDPVVQPGPKADEISVTNYIIDNCKLTLLLTATSSSANIGSNYHMLVTWEAAVTSTSTIYQSPLDSSVGTTSIWYEYSAGGNKVINLALEKDAGNHRGATSTTIFVPTCKTNPVIAWTPASSTITYGTSLDGILNASANIAGSFAYLEGLTPVSTSTILGFGPHTITANFSPTASSTYNDVSTTTIINVNKATPAIVWSNPLTGINFGTPLSSSTQLNATTNPSVSGSFVYTNATGTILGDGFILPVGNNQLINVQFYSSDSNYNGALATSSITVSDIVAPTITQPSGITEQAASSTGNIVIYSPIVVTDDADPAPVLTCTPASGDRFGLGSTSVNCTAVDSSNNQSATTTFTVTIIDTLAPEISFIGATTTSLEVLSVSEYIDAGAKSFDIVDGDRTTQMSTTSNVNTNATGTYQYVYTSSDLRGNTSHATRTVQVIDTGKPIITLIGSSTIYVEAGTTYSDEGAIASDNYDATSSLNIVTVNPVLTNATGTYTVTYNVSDSSGNAADEVTRTVIVQDTTAPLLTVGSSTIVKIGGTAIYPSVDASDLFDTSISSTSVIMTPSPAVDTNATGTYMLDYSVTDASGNIATTSRTLTVVPKSTNSPLSALSSALGVMSPSFSPSTLAYTVILPFGTTATPATFATVSDPFATTSITNALNVTSATSSDRTTTIVVTAEDGIASTTYTIIYSVAFQNVVEPVITIFGGGGSRSGGSRLPFVIYGPAVETDTETPSPFAELVTPAFAAEPETVATAGGATSTENIAENTETGNEALAAAVAGSTGLSWWWILLIGLILLGLIWFFWWLYKRRSKDDENQQINQ